MPRNLQVARPLASLHLHDTSLDDVVHVSVADGAVFTPPVINRAEDGLSAPPDQDLVAAWFNVILDNSDSAIEEPNASDPRREVALMLAVAEARYHRALHKVNTYDKEPNSAQQVANNLYANVRVVLLGMPERIANGPAVCLDLVYAEFGLRQVEKLLVKMGRKRRLYRRYLG